MQRTHFAVEIEATEWRWKNNFLEGSKKFRGVGSQDSQGNLMRNELGE